MINSRGPRVYYPRRDEALAPPSAPRLSMRRARAACRTSPLHRFRSAALTQELSAVNSVPHASLATEPASSCCTAHAAYFSACHTPPEIRGEYGPGRDFIIERLRGTLGHAPRESLDPPSWIRGPRWRHSCGLETMRELRNASSFRTERATAAGVGPSACLQHRRNKQLVDGCGQQRALRTGAR